MEDVEAFVEQCAEQFEKLSNVFAGMQFDTRIPSDVRDYLKELATTCDEFVSMVENA
ncbi:hypothetical protein PssvBMR6_gp20 [Pseudomonas phage MR6]|uniref:Uncharacterized protein n=1 Tax=Pseudomonas phage MR5 TaxID=2711172 RepID=A0A6M3TCP7_9CAUD|nr:hypothetical protein PssvBMR5_gp20 [Pseudomonas phage MR5]QJD54848.1 hypothetical protein PssvBMR6_gp20 [Pseudomonas phage MR6]QJD54907.1 hypothetical protein PssvBMR7_gp20 [Pseudomonas phage MR7]